jgi:hypothetical protein
MTRRVLSLAAALGLLILSLSSTPVTASSCEECEELCAEIPMDPGECLQLYCPECAGGSSPVGYVTPNGR